VTRPQTMLKSKAKPSVPRGRRHTARWLGALTCTALLIGAAVLVAVVGQSPSTQPTNNARPMRYFGIYMRDMPNTYAGVTAFTKTTGTTPDIVMYYSSWLEPFKNTFATAAAEHGAIPLVQINPFNVNLAAIANGQYDGYLSTFAKAVDSYHRPVILSFGHEMNGHWYPWGYTHTSSATFVAAWRHIVILFRRLGAVNVTWLWTVNIIDTNGGIRSPRPWWPGSAYVNWVGIDGYYYNRSVRFAPLFGPTIGAVRQLTQDPILISETAVDSAVGQPTKIADLFTGIHLYGLLGFVWFAVNQWRISSPAAIAAFRRAAQETYRKPAS
jgi:mannan endo-1,4-beta-mannosidase